MRTLASLVALLALAGCSKPKEEEAEQAPAPVEVAEVNRGSIERVVQAEAILYPVDQASVVPKLSAPTKMFYVKRGDPVQKGQLLATLENRELEASVIESKQLYQQAQSTERSTTTAQLPEDVNKAEQDVATARQALDAAERLYQSRKQLVEQGALARRLVDEADVLYVQARGQYDVATKHLQALESISRPEQAKGLAAQTEAAKARYDAAQAQLSYSEVRSPIAGIVADRPLYAGEMAAAGAPLLTVMDVSRVIARANIPVGQASSVRVGDRATIAQTDAAIEASGKVTVVSPATDPNSTTVEVWVEAENPGRRFKPGATVRVSIVAETVENALLVPSAALLASDEGGVQALVVGADSKAHEKKIEVGIREPGKVQVLSGLAPGDKVIIVGGVGLEDGAKVQAGRASKDSARDAPKEPGEK